MLKINLNSYKVITKKLDLEEVQIQLIKCVMRKKVRMN